MTSLEEELAAQAAMQKLKTGPPSVKLEQGENPLEGLSDEIKTVPSKYLSKPNQKILVVGTLQQPSVERSLWLSENNPVYREILHLAKKHGGIKGLKFTIVRIGEKENTKMSLKEKA